MTTFLTCSIVCLKFFLFFTIPILVIILLYLLFFLFVKIQLKKIHFHYCLFLYVYEKTIYRRICMKCCLFYQKEKRFIWFCGTMVVILIRGNKCWFILAVCHLGCWRNPEVVGMKHNYLCFDQFLNLYTLLMLNFAINCLYIFTSLLLPCIQCVVAM